MAGLMPSSIEQVNDFTGKASSDYIDALKHAGDTDPASALSAMLTAATKAHESQLLTDAVDAYSRAMEGGKSASDALKGLNTRMTGSAAFRDRADKVRSSILAQKASDLDAARFAETLRQQQQLDNANKLEASFMETLQNTPELAYKWMANNRDALNANPTAYKRIMGLAKGQDISPFVGSNEQDSFQGFDAILSGKAEDVERAKAVNEEQLSKLSLIGGVSKADLELLSQINTLDKFIDYYAKQRGYSGEDYRDFAQNMRSAYDRLVAHAQNSGSAIPSEAILAAMSKNLETPWESYIPLAGRFRQDDVNLTPAMGWIDAHGANFNHNKQMIDRASRNLAVLTSAFNNDSINAAKDDYEARVANYQRMYQAGSISADDYKIALEKLKIRTLSKIKNISNMVYDTNANVDTLANK